MAAIMEQQQGVRQGRRRAEKVPQQGTSEGKSLIKERGRTRLTDILWSGWLKLLLLLSLIHYSESSPVGNTPRSVMGEEGGNATLSCQLVDRNIIKIDLIRFSKIILVCQNEECKRENDRVFKEGTCDAIIKDLRLSDAGKYILRVYNDEQTIMEQYHLHFKDEISVKTGEQLKMDVLLINADKVEKNSSGEWTEVWTRGHGVSSDRLTDSNETLTIKEFRANDTGTYRVLDSEGEILITVTVTESSTGSKEKLNTYAQHKSVIIVVSVIGVLLVLVLISALIWKYQRQIRNTEHEPVLMKEKSTPEHLETTLIVCNLPSEPTDLEDCQHELIHS